jgi:hypothetical protein
VAALRECVGTYLAGIPLHGSPGIPLTLLVPVQGRRGFARPSSGVGSLAMVLVVTNNLDPKLTRNTVSELIRTIKIKENLPKTQTTQSSFGSALCSRWLYSLVGIGMSMDVSEDRRIGGRRR